MKLPESQFLRFCIVGTIGFVVDYGALMALTRLAGTDPWSGRLVSFLVAASATWVLNRRYTFRVRGRARADQPLTREWTSYVGYAAVGGAINYAAYTAWLWGADRTALNLLVGVALGSIAGLAFNFVSSKYLVFRPR